jgi:DNA-directed RNA polymerase subunit M/transcription elongation factor TFIIS
MNIEFEEEVSETKGTYYPDRQKPQFLKTDYRTLTRTLLKEKGLSEKNAEIIEKLIYNCSIASKKKSGGDLLSRIHADLSYEILNHISPKNVKPISEQLKENSVRWNSPEVSFVIDVQKAFESIGDFSRTEGVIECSRCIYIKERNEEEKNVPLHLKQEKRIRTKTNQTYSWQLQTRSADEPMTTFVFCTQCKCQFKYNN